MSNNTNHPLLNAGWRSFFKLILFVFGGLFVGQFLGLLVALPFLNAPFMELPNMMSNPEEYPSARIVLFIIQGVTALFMFIAAPWLYLRTEGRLTFNDLSFRNNLSFAPFLLIGVGVIVFMFVNSVFITWNMNLEFPEFMSGFERWARAQEDNLAKLTEYLVKTETNTELILAFVVVAILPAIGEEFLFRGVLQNIFKGLLKNKHVAIWLSAIIFSAIHMQFFGFLPRVILGALFGYIYVISGNLWYPIAAHFVNNGFTILLVALYQKGVIPVDIEDTESVPLEVVAPALIVFMVLSYIFIQYFKKNPGQPNGKLAESILVGDAA
jgi:membrane protease YdiL (CAAX protease family)